MLAVVVAVVVALGVVGELAVVVDLAAVDEFAVVGAFVAVAVGELDLKPVVVMLVDAAADLQSFVAKPRGCLVDGVDFVVFVVLAAGLDCLVDIHSPSHWVHLHVAPCCSDPWLEIQHAERKRKEIKLLHQ